jgi:DNA-binding beta-propeller fold protein YncE
MSSWNARLPDVSLANFSRPKAAPVLSLAVALSLALATPLRSAAGTGDGTATTTVPEIAPVVQTLTLTGSPFMALPSRDGGSLFVSCACKAGVGVAIFRRHGERYEPAGFVSLTSAPAGMALTRDGATLAVAIDSGLALFDAKAALGEAKPRYVDLAAGGGPIEVILSSDGAFAFVSEERAFAVAVVRLDDPSPHVVGEIPVDRAPVGLALSPDGTRLYVASEVAAPKLPRPPGRESLGGSPCRQGNGPATGGGTLTAIDAKRAERSPERAVLGRVLAGCSPVRIALSRDGALAYVTTRGDDRLAIYETAKIEAGRNDALRAQTSVGSAPVGVALVDGDNLAVVANSDRFASSNGSTADVLDTAAILAGRSANVAHFSTGVFPRELTLATDGKLVFLTNYRSRTVEVVSVAKLRP